MLNIRKENILENYFKPYLEEDYDIDIFQYLIEILNKNEPIKLDSDYLNDYFNRNDITEKDVWQYKNTDFMDDLKADMYDWVNVIKSKVEKIPGVDYVDIIGSNQAGLSTYLKVMFKRPDENDPIAKEKLKDDPKFLTHYFSGFGQDGGYDGEYRLKFRISNHPEHRGADTNVFMNILGHDYNWIKQQIIGLCNKRADQLAHYWQDYCRTGKISPKQIKRNNDRREGKDIRLEYLKNGYISDRHIKFLKETFGGDRLYTMLDTNVLNYLKDVNVDIEDIVADIEAYFQSVRIDYMALLYILTQCLNRYVIEYTFDDGFDYDLLHQDMKKEISKLRIPV